MWITVTEVTISIILWVNYKRIYIRYYTLLYFYIIEYIMISLKEYKGFEGAYSPTRPLYHKCTFFAAKR
jgi:hypothetical protein